MDFSQLHILVIGDIMLDEFIYGESHRNSPEFDAPVIEQTEKTTNLGGAGNVVSNLKAMGAKVSLVSVIGEDQNGQHISTLLHDIQVDQCYIYKEKNRPTTIKTRIYSNDVPIARLDHENQSAIQTDTEDKILSKVNDIVTTNHIDGIILQDYNKGVLTEKLIKNLILISKEQKIPSYIDPKINNIKAYKGCTYLKPNLPEIAEVLGYTPTISTESLDEAAIKLKQYVSHDTLVLTLSEKGAYFSDGYVSGIISTTPMTNADVCGAGDSFISAFCLASCSKLKIEESISFANAVSKISCSKKGVQSVNLNDLKAIKSKGKA